MSERGSFCTEYIYCDRCFEVCRRVIGKGDTKPEIAEGTPIIAGLVRASYRGGETHVFDYIASEIEAELCNDEDHEVRIAVMPEGGGEKFYRLRWHGHYWRYYNDPLYRAALFAWLTTDLILKAACEDVRGVAACSKNCDLPAGHEGEHVRLFSIEE